MSGRIQDRQKSSAGASSPSVAVKKRKAEDELDSPSQRSRALYEIPTAPPSLASRLANKEVAFRAEDADVIVELFDCADRHHATVAITSAIMRRASTLWKHATRQSAPGGFLPPIRNMKYLVWMLEILHHTQPFSPATCREVFEMAVVATQHYCIQALAYAFEAWFSTWYMIFKLADPTAAVTPQDDLVWLCLAAFEIGNTKWFYRFSGLILGYPTLSLSPSRGLDKPVQEHFTEALKQNKAYLDNLERKPELVGLCRACFRTALDQKEPGVAVQFVAHFGLDCCPSESAEEVSKVLDDRATGSSSVWPRGRVTTQY